MITRVKFCNEFMPEYIGFVFWEKSRRYVSPKRAEPLRKFLAVCAQAKPEVLR